MVTELDIELIPEVYDIVEEFGKDFVFEDPETRTYDPTTGVVTETNVTSVTRKVAPPSPYKEGYVPTDLIQEGDLKTFLPAQGLTFTPAPGYLVTFDSQEWRIGFASPIYSGESVAIWELLLRH